VFGTRKKIMFIKGQFGNIVNIDHTLQIKAGVKTVNEKRQFNVTALMRRGGQHVTELHLTEWMDDWDEIKVRLDSIWEAIKNDEKFVEID
jgi:hypothetical protein